MMDHPAQFTQLLVIILLGSFALGLGCVVAFAPKASVSAMLEAPESVGFHFVGGLFGGFVVLEILIAILMANDLMPELGPPMPYLLVLMCVALVGFCVAFKAGNSRQRIAAEIRSADGILREGLLEPA
ncbi:unnamed protein product [Polarella glacialis]|uniref:Uncharacterized protein n=1 Tax=Polarella glacialis TaxID=89957 RepID=A0A813FQI8_POLGL|nr:unnamed protein product [Polarella glacialis]CAE8709253.1 unnamed protein product [Polarella glacialis]|mmetsp:Transcript_23484/g.37785  ORF Transcript_23484/g.37785 Transcript_23484/m.37785 type:complete len:128 (-) Transcript_23484:73-456(-)